MKHTIQLFSIFLAITFITSNKLNGQFQPAPVEKSTQKVLFNGKVFYIHTVKANQTLYSISKTYGVSVQDIAAANPNISLEVLSEGEVLRIPTQSTIDSSSASYFGLSEDDFIYHTVKARQTIHYLSRKYGVSKEDLYYFNPGSDVGINEGQVIKIPKKHISEVTIQAQDIDTSNSYMVKEGDTLYSLSRKYGIAVSDLIQLNPQLRWGLKTGMRLNLTSDSQLSAIGTFVDSTQPAKSPQINLYSAIKCDSVKLNRSIVSKESIKLVLMLPFHAKAMMELESITNDSTRRKHPANKYRTRGVNFTEFYEGFLLAIDSLKKTGANIALFTYDTKSDTAQTEEIIKKLAIIKPDIIYGPIMPENIKRVSVYSEQNKIPMILPLTSNKNDIVNGNPYAISLLPDIKTEINQCSDYLSQFNDKNIILIHNEDSLGALKIDEFRETLFAYFSSKANYEEVLYKQIKVSDTLKQNLSHSLMKEIDNIVLVLSSSEASVSNIIGLLNINQSFGYSIQVFGSPVWQSFENLRMELLHQLNTVLYSPFFIDYNNKHTKSFVKKCRNSLGYEPFKTANTGSGYNFTFLGYEAGLMFTDAYNHYGPEFLNCLCQLKENMPQSQYQFKLDSKGGFTNTSINFINFNTDFDIKRIDFVPLHELNSQEKESDFDISTFITQ
jgi:LysM repeat protein/ABC-type branched-subunit amino acid transport system substrate-binding protein